VLEALGQLFVGSEPVGSAASWALDRLGRDRELLASVRAEVVRSRASPDALRQTRAVLAETLRLHPPFTVIGRQARVNAELGGIPIRAGDHLLVCPYLVHRDDRWWPRPETFDPSRWRNSSHSERPRLAYLPFGAGPRQCLGEHLAWRGMETTVAAVVSRWRISALGPPPPSTALRPAGVSVRLERASADRQ
jgi:cytochrome P450